MILKNYINLAIGQTHYRRAGEGKPVVLLHASPMSSEFMQPVINQFKDIADAVALDTPGYGNSDPLPKELLDSSDDLSPYVEWLRQSLAALGFDKVALYGTATGAQIALEYARAYPEQVDCLLLDNAAHFSEEECEQAMQHYFPDISPQTDGSHLQLVWDISTKLMQRFPWFSEDPEDRISDVVPPAAVINAIALAYLNAGDDYAQAYKRAFRNENANRLINVTVPTRVIRWQGSIVKKHTDRFDDFDWPDNIQMCFCEGGVEQRYQAIKQALQEFL